ncbi:hypothetical protein FIBSPDRAFT_965024 [Athelia psychrophila]|uniref:Proliferating cell nuclear antigen PCNA N-terminal domain-containing protein n=1 Tax=Athelia psychrophila TaxID=1759441 RepID=A0A165X3K9_9AGAM|nr:hypothetical protein FIBSPDRAFT_965024 [Fibularhizoctonia sp. CBS 109695]
MLKCLPDAIKELVTDANSDCTEEGINLQAMVNSHVASPLSWTRSGTKYRCDGQMPLGVNLGSWKKKFRI